MQGVLCRLADTIRSLPISCSQRMDWRSIVRDRRWTSKRRRKAYINIEAHQRQDRRKEVGYGEGFADMFSATLAGLPNNFYAKIASCQDDGRLFGRMTSPTGRANAFCSTELPSRR